MKAAIPKGRDTPDVGIIGGGSAGVLTAAATANVGAKVVLIERDAMGGEYS